METRKLRFILLAYLRGNNHLIRAYYPQGIRSKLRENCILDALQLQEAAERGMQHQMLMSVMCAPHYDLKKFKDTLHDAMGHLSYLKALYTLDIEATPPKKHTSVDGIVKLYQSLVKSGFAKEILKQHHRINSRK